VQLLALALAAIAFGIAMRVWIYRSSIGHLGTDEAVWGLMARHVLHGEVSAFFWGQAYGGTQEVFPVALLFWLFGTHLALMRVVPTLFAIAAGLVLWRAGRRLGGEVAGVCAALLLWVWPAYAAWKVQTWSGFYGSGLLYGALVLWLTLLLDDDATAARIALTGVVLGLAFWQTVQAVAVIVPALVWLTLRRPRIWLRAWIAVPGVLLGALPWLVSNLRHDWWSFTVRGGAGTYTGRLHSFVTATFPELLGLRVPFAVNWTFGTAVSGLLYAALIAALAVALWRWRRSPRSLPLAVLLGYPLVSVINAMTVESSEPRYVFMLLPALVLLAATVMTTVPRAAIVLAVAALVSAVSLARWIDWRDARGAVDRFNPGEVNVWPAVRALEQAGVDHAFAHYSIAYRMMFDSRERLIVSEADLTNLSTVAPGRVLPPVPTDYTMHRRPAFDRAVRSAPRFAYVFVRGEPGQARDVRLLRSQGFTEKRLGTLILMLSPDQ
jgi:4-amino-4-deoxy-L-arabinose transferase-like glycosyltransferase